MAVIGINYAESGREFPLDYKSVYLHYEEGEKLFDSGDFVKDWFECKKFIAKEDIIEKEVAICHSSSVDHFMMDGAPYDSAYLHMENGKPVLKYLDKNKNSLEQNDIFDNGWEYFVPEGTNPTWNELRVMCGMEPMKE